MIRASINVRMCVHPPPPMTPMTTPILCRSRALPPLPPYPHTLPQPCALRVNHRYHERTIARLFLSNPIQHTYLHTHNRAHTHTHTLSDKWAIALAHPPVVHTHFGGKCTTTARAGAIVSGAGPARCIFLHSDRPDATRPIRSPFYLRLMFLLL